jgi:hypothetical protein
MATYLRLRSTRTGHQWDASLPAAAAYLASGGVEIVGRRPPRTAARPRPAKHLTDLTGRPATPRQSARTKE